ncbi:DUF397 domain-containing protein [Saccharothrix coeruleofusca]|uniref:DUF397 domain-containing protein n=1 Tax=Saccharothrix coeruleofusca TaxID=33919 RepID=A0A918AI25_9PSEU|nr:DUF397 domain-containing protein [Saccharothrix coeruleofusca]GGP39107.1 hypothetical protein GCM10010185_08300 [Saccharothrix coeruleofusca]
MTEHDTGWFKSSYSTAGSNGCVEVRITSTGVSVRDSKDPNHPHFTLNTRAWAGFLNSLTK